MGIVRVYIAPQTLLSMMSHQMKPTVQLKAALYLKKEVLDILGTSNLES